MCVCNNNIRVVITFKLKLNLLSHFAFCLHLNVWRNIYIYLYLYIYITYNAQYACK